jgi:hypothetical protein
MGKRDEYLQNANECQRMADQSRNASDKSSWLRLAEKWLRMVPKVAKQKASDAFDTAHTEQGTGQRKSDSSH